MFARPPRYPDPRSPLHSTRHKGLPALTHLDLLVDVLHRHDLPSARAHLVHRRHPLLESAAHAGDSAGQTGRLDVGPLSRAVRAIFRIVPSVLHPGDAGVELGHHLHGRAMQGRHLMRQHLLQAVRGPNRLGRIQTRLKGAGIARQFQALPRGIGVDEIRVPDRVVKLERA